MRKRKALRYIAWAADGSMMLRSSDYASFYLDRRLQNVLEVSALRDMPLCFSTLPGAFFKEGFHVRSYY